MFGLTRQIQCAVCRERGSAQRRRKMVLIDKNVNLIRVIVSLYCVFKSFRYLLRRVPLAVVRRLYEFLSVFAALLRSYA